jgi:hypothetical protein
MDQIVLAKDFDISNITYNAPRVLETGGKSIWISYKKAPLYVQTPEMTAPFGLNKWPGEKSGTDKYSIDLSFKNRETNQAIQSFFDVVEALDAKLVQDALENSMSWFKKKYTSPDVVEALYTPMLKYAKDKATGERTDKFPPTFKFSVPFRDGRFGCEVYDRNRQQVSLLAIEEQVRGSAITAIIQCTGIWIAGGKFGCSWKAVQIRVRPPATIRGFAFKGLDDEPVGNDDAQVANELIEGVIGDVETGAASISAKTKAAGRVSDDSVLLEESDDDLDIIDPARA